MRKFLHVLTLILTSIPVLANPYPIKGTIKDAVTGEEIIGATVVIKEQTGRGTVSGLDGSFVLNNISTYPLTLTIGYIGYSPKEVKIESTEVDNFNILLEPDNFAMDAVTVAGISNRGSETSAIALQKNAMNVLEVISAKAIEISPDLNVANVLQRVPSVSLERTSAGQGQYAIIRGMDKRYSYTLVNGVKIPSPDNKFRYLPMDLFPADLLDKLVVVKALTPDMEGDAIGGAMDMVMKDAPARLTVNANAAVGYSTMFFDRDFVSFDASAINYKSPKEYNAELYQAQVSDFTTGNVTFKEKKASPNMVFGLSAGDRFINNKLGVIVAGSYQKMSYGNNSTFIDTSVTKETNDPFINTVTKREYSISEDRVGLHAKADYTIAPNHKIDAYFLWVNLQKEEFRNAVAMEKDFGDRISVFKRSRINEQNVLNGTFSGVHKFIGNRLSLDWTLAYSKAKQDMPDQVVIKLGQEQMGYVDNPTLLWNTGSTRRWERNDDKDLTGMLNASYTIKDFVFSLGALYRTKDRTNFYNEYKFDLAHGQQHYTSWADAKLTISNPLGIQQSPQNYTSDEDITAAYLMAKWNYGKWDILGGVRYEKTKMSWQTEAPSHIYGKTGSRDYYDILPSVNIKYALCENQSLRASYYASISRPGFFEVIPYLIPGEAGEEYSEAGNPYLKRVQADNIDVRYEIFPGGLDFLTVGMFYKNIKDPIEYSLSSSELKPDNFGTARNWGAEMEITKYFRNFGIRANYSFTDSRITTTKDVWGRRDENDSSSELVSRKVNQTRPLQGQSRHIGNLSFLYKNGRIGLDMQLAGIFTGRRIAIVSPYYEKDMWQRDMIQLDFSAEKTVYKKLGIYVKAGNLLDTPYILEIKGTNTQTNIPLQDKKGKVVVRKDKFGRNFLLGLRFKL